MTGARRMLAAAARRRKGRIGWTLTSDPLDLEFEAAAAGWYLYCEPIPREVARLILAGLVLVPVLERRWNALGGHLQRCCRPHANEVLAVMSRLKRDP